MKTHTVDVLMGSKRTVLEVPAGLPAAVLADACLAELLADPHADQRVGLDYGHGVMWYVPGTPGRATRVPDELA